MRSIHALAAFIASGVLVLGDDPASTGKSDLRKFQGTWRITAAESDGEKIPPEQYKHVVITIAGNLATEAEAGKQLQIRFELDATPRPKQIKSTYLDGPQQGMTVLGIYELQANRFRMCRASSPSIPRPTRFKTTKNSGPRGLGAHEAVKRAGRTGSSGAGSRRPGGPSGAGLSIGLRLP